MSSMSLFYSTMLGVVLPEEGVAEKQWNRKAISGGGGHTSPNTCFVVSNSSIRILSSLYATYCLWPVAQQGQMVSTAKVMYLCSLSFHPFSPCCSRAFKSSLFVVAPHTGSRDTCPPLASIPYVCMCHCGSHSDKLDTAMPSSLLSSV